MVAAVGLLSFEDAARIRHIGDVTRVGRQVSAEEAWRPELIVPGHRNQSFEWMDETREMFSIKHLRIYRIDYENAPFGRAVVSPSPYRWLLGSIAFVTHCLWGYPIGKGIETAALIADPLLLILLISFTAVYVAGRFGPVPAAVLAGGLAILYPFASAFLPGVPGSAGLALGCSLWSLLLLLPASSEPGRPLDTTRPKWRFFFAGLVGAAGVWVSASAQMPVLIGIGVGGLLAAWTARRSGNKGQEASWPWTDWGLGGASFCLLAYLVEFFPNHLSEWDLHRVHPVIGVAWLGAAKLLEQTSNWIAGRQPSRALRERLTSFGALLALTALPLALWRTRSLGFVGIDPEFMRLSGLPESPIAASFWALLLQNGITWPIGAALAPLLAVVPAVWVLSRTGMDLSRRLGVALTLGPLLVAVAFTCREISRASEVDCVLLVCLIPTTAVWSEAGKSKLTFVVGGVLVILGFLPGAIHSWPATSRGSDTSLTETEVITLVERDLAYSLQSQIGDSAAVALAPPDATTALYYYGQIGGLGTFGRENREGLGTAVRIISASTPEEAKELIDKHGVTHIVVPSWDPYMDAYAKLGEGQVEGTFLERLHQWKLPPWLRPIPYLLPTIPGFQDRSVIVLNVVDDQKDAVAASRLAEYFVDMGAFDLAATAGANLRKYPGAAGAVLAEAEVAAAQGETSEFNQTVEVLLRRISGGADRTLPWDQKVRLAIVLARAGQLDLARKEVKQCLENVDGPKLRLLSPQALVRFNLLQRAFGLEIVDAKLRATERDLLPRDVQVQRN